MSKKIILISYFFPPSNEIGGRRWGKFANYLAKKGHDVFVICAPRPSIESDLHSNIHVTELAIKYPGVLISQPKTFLEKLKYHFWIRVLPFLYNGTIYDKGIFWENQLFETLDKITKTTECKTVIVTGAPFSLLYYCGLYKEKNPQLKVIMDLRDPWTWGRGYGMQELSTERFRAEESKEASAVFHTDHFLVPSEAMCKFLRGKYSPHKSKISVLPHAFDKEKLDKLSVSKPNDGIRRFIYGGSLYEGLDNEFLAISQVFKEQDDCQLDLFSKQKNYQSLFGKDVLDSKVFYRGFVTEDELFQNVLQSDYYLLAFPEIYKDFISSKFYELIYLKIPIIYIGEKGLVSELISENNLGLHIYPSDVYQKLTELFALEKPMTPQDWEGINRYSFDAVTDSIISMLD